MSNPNKKLTQDEEACIRKVEAALRAVGRHDAAGIVRARYVADGYHDLKDRGMGMGTDSSASHLLDAAFHWIHTPEGHKYWKECYKMICKSEAGVTRPRVSGDSCWVPISEQLPDVGQTVLCWPPKTFQDVPCGFTAVLRQYKSRRWFVVEENGVVYNHQPTHWMPLPPPPTRMSGNGRKQNEGLF